MEVYKEYSNLHSDGSMSREHARHVHGSGSQYMRCDGQAAAQGARKRPNLRRRQRGKFSEASAGTWKCSRCVEGIPRRTCHRRLSFGCTRGNPLYGRRPSQT